MNIVIVGAGDIGYNLAKRLSYEKHNITIIEKDKNKVMQVKENLDAIACEGSGSNPKILKDIAINQADVLVALSDVDEVNILACKFAKVSGVPLTIARVREIDFVLSNDILSKDELGVDYFIQPEMLTANAIVRLVRQSSATDIIDFEQGKVQLIGIRLETDNPILKIPLKDIWNEISDRHLNIVAIKRRQFTIIPRGDDYLLKGDQIFIICEPNHIPDALKLFKKTNVKIENLMLIGGGLIGRLVAKQLCKNINTKIIEINKNKSMELAENLPDALVINGDGADFDLLSFEGIQDMDELITVTGDDETNIMTSLVANHLKVPRTITLIKKLEYSTIGFSIGLNSVISKQLITINTIQKLIRSQNVAFFAELPGLDAEIIEYIVPENSKITKKQLKQLSFPSKAIIGAVIRHNGQLEIPKGDTEIFAKDRVIVFCMPQAINNVNRFFE